MISEKAVSAVIVSRVKVADPTVRKHFTVAHELAHFLIHRNRFSNRLVEDRMYRSGLGSGVEAEANRLAADLLMPRRIIRRLIADGIESPEQMAKIFKSLTRGDAAPTWSGQSE